MSSSARASPSTGPITLSGYSKRSRKGESRIQDILCEYENPEIDSALAFWHTYISQAVWSGADTTTYHGLHGWRADYAPLMAYGSVIAAGAPARWVTEPSEGIINRAMLSWSRRKKETSEIDGRSSLECKRKDCPRCAKREMEWK